MSFTDKSQNRTGEMFIRYQRLNSTLKYQLFEGKKNNPTLIDIKFVAISPTKTKITWFVNTPKQPLLKRPVNLWTQDDFADNLDKSMVTLANVLGNKVGRDNQLASIKYDSLMVEEKEGGLLLGINVSTSNKKDALFKNIIQNHNKILNFVTMDLGKRDDEYGQPVLITDPVNFKDREVSYFYGVPLSKRVSVTDNNFSFRTMNASKVYILYYKGSFAGRTRSIQQLMTKAKRDTMRNGELQQTFIEPPIEGKDVMMKLVLPVYR